MKRLLLALLALGSAILAMPTFAQTFYAGGSIGQSHYRGDCLGSCDKTDAGFKVFGGYMFSPQVGIEAHYVDLGKRNTFRTIPTFIGPVPLGTELDASGVGASLVGAFPIENFSIFGKVGFTYMDLEARASVGVTSTSESEKNTELSVGLGASYSFTQNFGVRVEWERFRAEILDANQDIDYYSIGIQFRF